MARPDRVSKGFLYNVGVKLMKLEMGNAWSDAVSLVRNNLELVAIVAGVFVLLPQIVTAIFVPEYITGTNQVNPEDALASLMEIYSDIFIWVLFLTVLGAIGSLSLLALLKDERPTVGDAIKTGAKTLFPYLAGQFLLMVGMLIVIGVPAALAFGLADMLDVPAVGLLILLPAFLAIAYLSIKFSLFAPAMVLDGIRSPIEALKASWRATKGNSLRLVAFFFLIFGAAIIVLIIYSMITGLLIAALGTGSIASIVLAVNQGLIGSVWSVLSVAVLSAVYRQLSGPNTDTISETFS